MTVILAAGLVAGCSTDNSDSGGTEGQQESSATPAMTYTPAETSAQVAGITFHPDVNWIDNGPSGMRAADYMLAPQGDDQEPASLAVFYFGPSSGGGVEANLQRWIGQVSIPAGENPRQTEIDINGMKAHLLEVHGTYNQSMGGPMSSQTEAKEGYSMYTAVLETDQGNVFFKLTGPAATATAMNKQFTEMLKAIKQAA
jgi:hypothetical protein